MKSFLFAVVAAAAFSLSACASHGPGHGHDGHHHGADAKCTHDAAKCEGCKAGTCDPSKCPMKAGQASCCGKCEGDATKCTGAKTDAPKACCGKGGGK
ncbi:MAG: hypothetical protein HMLKMBBP_00146 [Planctomycetes bacterium]|nr:hypothetical protein [Planctomycetota bacterium]